jgi:3-oxoacid CoA-transferase subunit A
MKQNVYIMGDIHGSFKPVRSFCQRNPRLYRDRKNGESNVLIMLGDFGANYFFDYRDDNFKSKLSKYPLIYFVIRGNHEERPSICAAKNPDKWHIEQYFDNLVYVENDYPHIKYASDEPAYYNINGHSTMIFPGAFSVDKVNRLRNGWSWFENEQLTESEMNLGREMVGYYGGCDLVLSHTCPIMFEPTDLFLSVVDQSMVDKTMERYLGEIEYNLDYRAWCWGHYHEWRKYPQTDGRRRLMLFNDAAVELENLMNGDVITPV